MNLLKMLKEKRQEVQQERYKSKAERLVSLREERIRQEGRAKIIKAQREEEGRIKKAKQEQFKNSNIGLLASRLKTIKQNNTKTKKKTKKKNKVYGFGQQPINPAFSLGKR